MLYGTYDRIVSFPSRINVIMELATHVNYFVKKNTHVATSAS